MCGASTTCSKAYRRRACWGGTWSWCSWQRGFFPGMNITRLHSFALLNVVSWIMFTTTVVHAGYVNRDVWGIWFTLLISNTGTRHYTIAIISPGSGWPFCKSCTFHLSYFCHSFLSFLGIFCGPRPRPRPVPTLLRRVDPLRRRSNHKRLRWRSQRATVVGFSWEGWQMFHIHSFNLSPRKPDRSVGWK